MHRVFGSRAMAIVAVSALAVVGGALLAWWQWTRYQSASGTLQNLGYVLQWPLFGVFPAFMFWRIRRTARRERALDAAATTPTPAPVAEAVDDRWTYTQNKTETYSVDEDVELLAYNQFLADLSAKSADREHRHAG